MKRRRGPDRQSLSARPLSPGPDDPGAAEARGRLDATLDRLTRVGLQVVVVAPPDRERLTARDRARDAAIASGRGQLLDEATAAARNVAVRAFANAGFSGTWAATDWSVSVVSAEDRVAAAAAFEEAAIGAVVEDLVDDETLDVLRSTSNELAGMTAMPSPGSLSAITAPLGVAIRGPMQVGILVVLGIFLLVAGVGAASILVVALGLAIVGGLARGRRSDP
jgi:hypothetical protein